MVSFRTGIRQKVSFQTCDSIKNAHCLWGHSGCRGLIRSQEDREEAATVGWIARGVGMACTLSLILKEMGRYWFILKALASLCHWGLFCGSGAAACTHEWPLLSQTQKSFVLTHTKQIILENERTQLNPKLGCIKMAPWMTLFHPEPDS